MSKGHAADEGVHDHFKHRPRTELDFFFPSVNTPILLYPDRKDRDQAFELLEAYIEREGDSSGREHYDRIRGLVPHMRKRLWKASSKEQVPGTAHRRELHRFFRSINTWCVVSHKELAVVDFPRVCAGEHRTKMPEEFGHG